MTKDVSVVIPSLEGDPLTVESLPEEVEYEVVINKPRAEARNIGARRTDGEIIVFCDDDIKFSEEQFWKWVEEVEQGRIIGLEDWDYGLLITRFMVITRDDFENIGGFDESLNYMEDTEFCLNALSRSVELSSYSRSDVYHEPHESAGKSNLVIIKNTMYIALKYPKYAPKLVFNTIIGGFSRKVLGESDTP